MEEEGEGKKQQRARDLTAPGSAGTGRGAGVWLSSSPLTTRGLSPAQILK